MLKNVRYSRGKPKAGEDSFTYTRDTRRRRFRVRLLVPYRDYMIWTYTWVCLVSSLPLLTDSISPFRCQEDASPSSLTSASIVCSLDVGEEGAPSTYSQAQRQVEDKSSENEKYCFYDEFWDEIHVIESVENDSIIYTTITKAVCLSIPHFRKRERCLSISHKRDRKQVFYGKRQVPFGLHSSDFKLC